MKKFNLGFLVAFLVLLCLPIVSVSAAHEVDIPDDIDVNRINCTFSSNLGQVTVVYNVKDSKTFVLPEKFILVEDLPTELVGYKANTNLKMITNSNKDLYRQCPTGTLSINEKNKTIKLVLPAQDDSKTYQKITCGEMEIPRIAANITSTIIQILKIATPLIIILLGSVDLIKAVMAQKEDEIKKGQQTFIRRLLVGCLVFLAFFIIELIIGFIKPKNDNVNMWNCVDCFVTGKCDDIAK